MTLDHFYLDMDLWLKGQWPTYLGKNCPFDNRKGICASFLAWCMSKDLPYVELDAALMAEFEEAGLHAIWPFGTDKEDLYTGARLNWIGLRADRATERQVKLALRDLLAWVDKGCPDHESFRKSGALCISVNLWLQRRGCSAQSDWLESLFEAEGLAKDFPFNGGSASNFRKEVTDHTLYQNPKRLAWLRSHT